MSTKLLDLTKTLELNLVKAEILTVPVMAVKLLVDKSGSMDAEFRNGFVQDTIDLLLVAAMKFDDDGKMQIGFFNHSFIETPEVTAEDVGTYIKRYGIGTNGGTAFAAGIKAFKGTSETERRGWASRLFSRGTVDEKPTPVYISLITDGDNADKAEFERELKGLDNTFVQIVAIGSGCNKSYLDSVAKKYDNVGVIYLPNPSKVTPDSFYEQLLNEDFKKFIKEGV